MPSKPIQKDAPQTLGPAGEQAVVPDEIRSTLLSADDIKDGAELSTETIRADGEQIRLLVRARGRFLCSPTGNCPHWIFRKTVAGYAEEVDLGSAQRVRIETGTAKIPEVVAQQHASATDSELRLYQYDGTQYRLARCMSQSYRDPNDIDRILEKPIITDIPCRQ